MNTSRLPWWVALIIGFAVSTGGQFLVTDLIDKIAPGSPDLTIMQQAALAFGAIFTAGGSILISRSIPERPKHLGRWESIMWGPMVVTLSGAVVLMGLLSAWVIPETIKAIQDEISLERKALAAAFGLAVVAGAMAASFFITLYARQGTGRKNGGAPSASSSAMGNAQQPRPLTLWDLSLALFLLVVASPRPRRPARIVKGRS